MIRFEIHYPEGKVETAYSESKTALVGRAPLVNDVRVDHPSVSRQHAQVKKIKSGFQVKDLDSRNGLIHKDAVVKKVDLEEGEEIFLGDVKLNIYEVQESLKKSIESKVLSSQEVEAELESNAMEKELAVQTHEDARKIPKKSKGD